VRYNSAPFLLAILLVAGCSAPPLQAVSPDQIPGGNVVALARFECAVAVGKGGLFTSSFEPQLPTVPTLEMVVGDSASGGEPRWTESRKDFHRLSKEATAQGWTALIKPPGYYYLHFVGITQGYTLNLAGYAPEREVRSLGPVSDPLGHKPTLRIELPPQAPIVYIGTIRIDCPTPEDVASVFVRSALASVADEHEAAVRLALREFPSLPPPVTRLAARQSGPILLGVPPSYAQ
jgi:hypothetical protein